MKIRASNPLTNKSEKSYLTTSYSNGASSVVIINSDEFTANQKIMIGDMGNERTEIVTISSVSGTTINLSSPTLFAHEADTPVYVLKYDIVRFYRSTTGINGAYTIMSGGAISMDVDNQNLETVFDDTAGLSTYYYEVSFYSTFDTTESALSNPIAGTGYPRGTVGAIINETFAELGDTTQQNMSVQEAINLLNEVNDDLMSQSRRPYRFLKVKKALNITGGNPRVPLPTDLYKFHRMAYTNALSNRIDDYQRISMEEMEYINFDNTTPWTDDLIYISIDETTNELVLFPTPLSNSTGSIIVFYWRKFNELVNLSDIIETPNQRVYKLFLMGRYYRKRSVTEPTYAAISTQYLSDYNTEIVKMQRSNKLDLGTPDRMRPDTHHERGLRRF